MASPSGPDLEAPDAEASAKPRVLLSILEGEGFNSLGDTSDLFTTIIAGFGRFECERVLKPGGVELMNLAQTAIIEISVQRRSRDTGQGSLLYRGRVPLAALHPSFFGKVASEGVAHVEPQIWESWLGLLSADISLKGQTPESIFQQCVEMGNSQVRTSPRLYVRLQYLHTSCSLRRFGAIRAFEEPPVTSSPLASPAQGGLFASQTALNPAPPSFGGSASGHRALPVSAPNVFHSMASGNSLFGAASTASIFDSALPCVDLMCGAAAMPSLRLVRTVLEHTALQRQREVPALSHEHYQPG